MAWIGRWRLDGARYGTATRGAGGRVRECRTDASGVGGEPPREEREAFDGEIALRDLANAADADAAALAVARFATVRAVALSGHGAEAKRLARESARSYVDAARGGAPGECRWLDRAIAPDRPVPARCGALRRAGAYAHAAGHDAGALSLTRCAYLMALLEGYRHEAVAAARTIADRAVADGRPERARRWGRRAELLGPGDAPS